MTDLRARFSSADELPAPDLWREIETRALAMSAAPAPGPAWLMIGLAALLMVGIGSAVLFGSGLVELPVLPEPSPSESIGPSPTVDASPAESESPSPSLTPSNPPPDVSTWTATRPMVAVPREGFTATLLPDGRVLVAGGPGEGGAPQTTASVFDPETMSWTPTGDMVLARGSHAATLITDGRRTVMVTGGDDDVGIDGTHNSAEVYDLVDEVWSPWPRMIESRSGHTATHLLDGRVLIAGGASDGGPSAEVFDFDPTVLSWTATDDTPWSPSQHTATLLTDGRVLVVDDARGTAQPPSHYAGLATLYDPDGNSWSLTGELSESRGGHTATRLLDGRVLVSGGGSFPWGATAEIFDPEAGSWTTTGTMTEARGYHTATLLSDGRVLVAGGGDGGFGGSPTAELYDPATGQWTGTRNMLSPRGWHTAVSLADGRVLLIGGYGLSAPADPRAEVYDPDGGN